MNVPLDAEGPIYYGHIAGQMRAKLEDDPREPGEWSDGDKLRLLALLFDEADLLKGNTGRDVQNDLRRMAQRLDFFDRLDSFDEDDSEIVLDPARPQL